MIRRLLSFLLIVTLFVACRDKGGVVDEAPSTDTVQQYTIAVIMPLANETKAVRWRRTAAWLQENFAKAQADMEHPVRFNIEWIDEDSTSANGLKTLAQELAHRDDVMAVVGPQTSDHCQVVADQLIKTKKMMVAPSASSDDLLRAYAGKKFFWALCESDITESGLLLSIAKADGARSISLIAGNSMYAATFLGWVGFQATELGMKTCGTYDVSDAAQAMCDSSDYVICVPDKAEEVKAIVQAHATAAHPPKLLFSDMAVDPSLLADASLEGIEGVSPYASPSSSFVDDYKSRFGTLPLYDEIVLYDALLTSALSLQTYDTDRREGTAQKDINKAMFEAMSDLMAATTTAGDSLPRLDVWDAQGMAAVIHNHGCYNITGASGTLDFELVKQSCVQNSVYCHWRISGGMYVPIDYSTPSLEERSWIGSPVVVQPIPDTDVDISYPLLQSKWAVLVCGTQGWFNYRHHGDVLNVYQLLRANGFDDDHIILIASPTSIALDKRNIYFGEIRGQIDGPNLLADVVCDYDTDTLNASDISDILLGRQSQHLPTVLHTDQHSNVLFYWTGHGQADWFTWKGTHKDYEYSMLQNDITQMHGEGRYRKLLICAEPCFSGSMLYAIQGIPGTFGIASSNSGESSFADVYDGALGTWLSDRFTNHLVSNIASRPDITFHDLFMNLVHSTYGSHVTLFNYTFFDNLYKSSPKEFFYY